MRRTLPAFLVLGSLFVTCTSPPAGGGASPAAPATRGAALFARHCAVCHGEHGDGDTVVAEFLRPRPAPFRDGLFKLVSTNNGVPSDADLVATLRRGMPGSTMMAWGWLPDPDLYELAQHVRTLTVQGRAETIARTARLAGRPLDDAAARTAAERQLQPGPAVETGDPSGAAVAFAEGKRLFERHCANCHGFDGRGLPATANLPTDGDWLWPRDLVAGYLRGTASARDIACRIRAGMPGARMPPTPMSGAETEALASYVRGLIPEQAAEQHVQWRRNVRVAKVPALPAADDAAAWAKLDTVRLPVAPLWWRAEAVHEVFLRTAHDGTQLAMQFEWADATCDDRMRPDLVIGDGIAVQFAASMDPPLFAMGSSAEPVNVWRWHAFDPKQVAGLVDLLTAERHQQLDVPSVRHAPAARGESIRLGGIDSVRGATSSGLPLAVDKVWRDGRWTVTLRRTLAPRAASEVAFAVGKPVLFSLGIWNGAVDASPASKSITTWHALELQ